MKEPDIAKRRRRGHTVRFEWFLHKIAEEQNKNPSVKSIYTTVKGINFRVRDKPAVTPISNLGIGYRMNADVIRYDGKLAMEKA